MKLSAEVASASTIDRAIVLEADPGGAILVQCEGEDQPPVTCDFLIVDGLQGCPMTPGDSVLVWRSSREDERGVVIGRISTTPSLPREAPPPATNSHGIPEELIFEAGQSLTLRVGDGSITIRADGKILIKGKDLVSHAQRTNRIRGGSVAIN